MYPQVTFCYMLLFNIKNYAALLAYLTLCGMPVGQYQNLHSIVFASNPSSGEDQGFVAAHNVVFTLIFLLFFIVALCVPNMTAMMTVRVIELDKTGKNKP